MTVSRSMNERLTFFRRNEQCRSDQVTGSIFLAVLGVDGECFGELLLERGCYAGDPFALAVAGMDKDCVVGIVEEVIGLLGHLQSWLLPSEVLLVDWRWSLNELI